jgi:hypothetical protein
MGIQLRDTSSILDWITTSDIALAISWIIDTDTPTEVDIGTSIGFTNVEFLMNLESLLGHTNQWAQQIRKSTTLKNLSVVGKDSPLFISGWLPKDDLITGLQRVLDS